MILSSCASLASRVARDPAVKVRRVVFVSGCCFSLSTATPATRLRLPISAAHRTGFHDQKLHFQHIRTLQALSTTTMSKRSAPDSDDEFGLSSGDEADLLDAENKDPSRRRSEGELHKKVKLTTGNHKASPNVEIARRTLRDRFGIPQFRLKQEQAIDHLLAGNSAVVVFPTGTLCRSLFLAHAC